ncbi:hypothetical protein [Kribbella sp. CA-293567]|uniref:hypothetical protein n=1 Tax=Kribbella sp. CA-293567 TaxID=3002436 RepID=UPI0022DE1ABB|nr:hypothetical protein [Kribbella sp. CA-293567]WBQ06892.1 hypothetical protein OX958_08860 [Kribbella sp. CA-293567]
MTATTPLLSISLPTAEIDPNTVKPGWVALLIVLGLGVATFLLWRNMAKQLKRINFDPDAGARDRAPSDVPPPSSPDQDGAAGPAPTETTTGPTTTAEPATTVPTAKTEPASQDRTGDR